MLNIIILAFVLIAEYFAGKNGLIYLAIAMGACYVISMIITFYCEHV